MASQDLRNHGDSPHDNRHDYTSMAKDVEEFINHHRLREPALIGHSMLVSFESAISKGCDLIIIIGAPRWL